jgi:uncharacterized protein
MLFPAAAFLGGSMLAQGALVFVLAVVIPLWDRYEIPRLKASRDPRKRIRFYRRIIAVEWICAAVAFLTIGWGALFTIHAIPGEIDWLSGSTGSLFVMGLVTAMAVVLVLPVILAIWSPKVREKAAKAAERLSYLLPSNSEERIWWWPALCITAGFCEEVLYRGFLLRYFHTSPFHLSLTSTLVVAAVIFGIGHLYQGVKPALATVVLGFALSCVFVVTGSLLIPIIAHALLDLRVLVLLPAGSVPVEKAA